MKAWEPGGGWAIAATTTGVNVHAASWPHMGAIGASKGQLPLGRDAATCVLLLLYRTVVAPSLTS